MIMKQRIITGTIILIALILVVLFSWTPIFPALLSLCSVIAVYEMARCVGMKKAYAFNIPLSLIAAAYPFLIRYISDPDLLRKINFIIIMCVPLYFFTVMTFSHGKYTISDVSVLFTTAFYILLGFNAMMLIYQHRTAGELLYLTIFIGAWITDVFAYFCGMLFGRGGKHKLIPDVSPKKTVEGCIGGIVFCMAFMTLFGFVVGLASDTFEPNLLSFALAGLMASIVAQLGDLFMSVIKRNYGIKDYGTIFAGHGGVLDRFDSILAVSIALAAFSSFFDFFKVI